MTSAKTVLDIFKYVAPIHGHGFDSAQDVLTYLKFIGMLQPGDKIDTHNRRIESNNLFTPIKRLFLGEGRTATYSFFSNTIERAFAILYSLAATEKVSDNMVCAHILIDMHKAVVGIMNMQNTYKDDKMFVCNLETLIQTINAKTIEVQQRYPQIYDASLKVQTMQNSSPLLKAVLQATKGIDDTNPPPLSFSDSFTSKV